MRIKGQVETCVCDIGKLNGLACQDVQSMNVAKTFVTLFCTFQQWKTEYIQYVGDLVNWGVHLGSGAANGGYSAVLLPARDQVQFIARGTSVVAICYCLSIWILDQALGCTVSQVLIAHRWSIWIVFIQVLLANITLFYIVQDSGLDLPTHGALMKVLKYWNIGILEHLFWCNVTDALAHKGANTGAHMS